MKRRFILLFLLSAICCRAAAPSQPPANAGPLPRFRVIDLGTLPGCDVTFATGINAQGWVIGYAYPFVPPGHGNSMLSRAFLWRNGRMTALKTAGGEHSQALGINDRGDICGWAERSDGSDMPVIWKQGGGRPVLLAGGVGAAHTLNAAGHAAGYLNTQDAARAAVWRAGKLIIIGDPTSSESYVLALNRKGHAVGYALPAGSRSSWMQMGRAQPVHWPGDRQQSLPTLGGHRGYAQAIDDEERIAGWCEDDRGRQLACLWEQGRVTRLPSLGGVQGEACGFGPDKMIVGETMDGQKRIRACLWRAGKVIDLNACIPSNSGWHLHHASAINAKGWIVGFGHSRAHPGDRMRAFLLRPEIPGRGKASPILDKQAILRIAKEAVRRNETWADRATCEVKRDGDGWAVMVWRIEGYDAKGRPLYTPGGHRLVLIERNGAVVRYIRGR